MPTARRAAGKETPILRSSAVSRAGLDRRGFRKLPEHGPLVDRKTVTAVERDSARARQAVTRGPIERQPASEIKCRTAVRPGQEEVSDTKPFGAGEPGGHECVGPVDEVVRPDRA